MPYAVVADALARVPAPDLRQFAPAGDHKTRHLAQPFAYDLLERSQRILIDLLHLGRIEHKIARTDGAAILAIRQRTQASRHGRATEIAAWTVMDAALAEPARRLGAKLIERIIAASNRMPACRALWRLTHATHTEGWCSGWGGLLARD